MRILAGLYKGRVIKMPEGIRPTQDKVRKALFDILKDCIEGASFLELFAGSGAIGMEALSRGAKEVVFVENNPGCVKVLTENLAFIPGGYRILPLDVLKSIEKFHQACERFDIVFLDPPYYKDLAKNTLQTLNGYDILHPDSLVIVQHYKRDQLPESLGKLVLWRTAKYGDTLLSFYRKANSKS